MRYKVRIRWLAEAVVEVEAGSQDEAEKYASIQGLPWDDAYESDDGEVSFVVLKADGASTGEKKTMDLNEYERLCALDNPTPSEAALVSAYASGLKQGFLNASKVNELANEKTTLQRKRAFRRLFIEARCELLAKEAKELEDEYKHLCDLPGGEVVEPSKKLAKKKATRKKVAKKNRLPPIADLADSTVVKVLRSGGGTMSSFDVQSALREARIPEAEGRVAVLRLADNGIIRIREDRQIELVVTKGRRK